MPGDEIEEYLARARDAGCTERQVECLRLLVAEGLAQAEIALRLGTNQPAVSRMLTRAMRHLEREEDRYVLRAEVYHLVEQEIEEVVSRGDGDDEDTVSVWRDATLRH